MKKLCLTILIFFSSICLKAQNKLDSLYNIWQDSAQPDSTRALAFSTYIRNGFLFSQPDSAYVLAEELIDFSIKKNFMRGKVMGLRSQGTSFRIKDKYTESLEYTERALAISELLGNQKDITVSLIDIGLTYEKKGEYSTAMEYYERSLILAQKTGDQIHIASILNNIGVIHVHKGDYSEALKIFKRSLSIKEIIGDLKGIANSLNNIGFVYENLGNYPKALEFYKESLSKKTELNDQQGMLNTVVNIGNIFYSKGNYPKAIEYYQQSLVIAKSIDNQIVMSNSLSSIGTIYSDQDNYEKALEYYKRSLDITKKAGAKREIATKWYEIGTNYSNLGELNMALKYCDSAIALQEKIEDIKGKAYSLNTIGSIYSDLRNYQQSLNYFERSITIGEQIGEQRIVAIGLYEIGLIHQKQDVPSKSIASCQKALELAESIGLLEQRIDACQCLYDAYKTMGKNKVALNYLEKVQVLNDSLNSAESEKKLRELEFQKAILQDSIAKAEEARIIEEAHQAEIRQEKQTRTWYILGGTILFVFSGMGFWLYRVNEKRKSEKEIQMLTVKQAQSELKALRSQMNPHFIFNALQSIQNFLLNHKSEEASEHLLKFSKLMRNVLENSRHDEVLIEEDLEALELYIELEKLRFPRPFSHTITIDNSVIPDEDMIPPLILQPFVENAIWHGLKLKKDTGAIDINISKQDNFLYCTVVDNGVGRQKVSNKQKTDTLKKASLGLKITKERLSLRDSRLNLSSSLKIVDLKDDHGQPRGTRVELTIPLST